MKRLFLYLTALVFVFGSVGQVKATFTLDTIDFPNASFTAGATGINNRGQIVGVYVDSSGVRRGFLLDKGNFSTVDFPNALETNANGINDHSQIVGWYRDSSRVWKG